PADFDPAFERRYGCATGRRTVDGKDPAGIVMAVAQRARADQQARLVPGPVHAGGRAASAGDAARGDQAGDVVRPHTSPVVGRLAARASDTGRAALAARRDRVVEMQLGRGRRADGERARDPPGSIVGETAANLVCRAGAGQPGRVALVLVPVALEAAIGRARRDEPAVAIEAECDSAECRRLDGAKPPCPPAQKQAPPTAVANVGELPGDVTQVETIAIDSVDAQQPAAGVEAQATPIGPAPLPATAAQRDDDAVDRSRCDEAPERPAFEANAPAIRLE